MATKKTGSGGLAKWFAVLSMTACTTEEINTTKEEKKIKLAKGPLDPGILQSFRA